MADIVKKTPELERLFQVLARHSFKTGDFVLASGARSNYYLDCRTTSLHPEGATLIGSLFFEAVKAIEAHKGITIAAVGGMTMGADPLATAVSVTSYLRGAPLYAFIVRKEEKSHGRGGLVVGRENLPDQAPVVMLEDVVTSGGSTLQAMEKVRDSGLNPVAVLALVDRLAGGREAFEQAGVDFYPLFTKDDFLAR